MICVTDMQQSGVYDLLRLLELAIEESFTIIPNKFVVVKPDEILTLIDILVMRLNMLIMNQQKADYKKFYHSLDENLVTQRLLITYDEILVKLKIKLINQTWSLLILVE